MVINSFDWSLARRLRVGLGRTFMVVSIVNVDCHPSTLSIISALIENIIHNHLYI
jgi:hypothetical protein